MKWLAVLGFLLVVGVSGCSDDRDPVLTAPCIHEDDDDRDDRGRDSLVIEIPWRPPPRK